MEEENVRFCSPLEQLVFDFKEQDDYKNMTDYLLARLVVAAENIGSYVEERAVAEHLKDLGLDPNS